MSQAQHAAELPDLLAAAWPPMLWGDVHVVVAVSGGADSMALLRGLLELKRRTGGEGQIYAAHVNHQLRGDASAADEAWLRQECRQLDVQLLVDRVDTAALAQREGDGLEAAARDARYRSLTALAESVGARFVATGHTGDDQVETVLLQLVRGTGLRGLAGMRFTRPLSSSVSLVRPLLSCGRSDVLSYLTAVGQGYREDASNAESLFARNRVRHELLPFLRESFNREVDASVARVASMAAEAQGLIDDLAANLLEKCREPRAGSNRTGDVVLHTACLAGQREIVVREVLRRAWREAGFAEQAMTHQRWHELAHFAQSPATSAALMLPGSVRATRPEPDVLALTPAGLP